MKRANRYRFYCAQVFFVALTLIGLFRTAGAGRTGDRIGSLGAAGTQYFVSHKGDDRNPGSRALPWKTIGRAAQEVRAGDVVHIAPGVYAESITTNVSGLESARIRFISDRKWQALVRSQNTAECWTNQGNYVDIEGFDISGCLNHGILNLGSHVRVIGNHVHDLPVPGCNGTHGGAGIDHANYQGHDDDTIANVVNDIGTPGICNGVHGIYHANLGGHIWNNIVYRNSAWGIHLWHAADRVVIANNLLFSNGASLGSLGWRGGGIVIGDGDAPGDVTAENITVSNNIVCFNPGFGIREYGRVGKNSYLHNLVHGNGIEVQLLNGNTLVQTITKDPQFVDFQPDGRGDYHLASTSPAIGSGTSLGAPGIDYDQRVRTAYDLGPFSAERP